MTSQIGYVGSDQVLTMFSSCYDTKHAMLQRVGGISTRLYCFSYLCIIMHVRNTNSDASVEMVSPIMSSVANSAEFMACSIMLQAGVTHFSCHSGVVWPVSCMQQLALNSCSILCGAEALM